jgi:mRNA interferase YafQ
MYLLSYTNQFKKDYKKLLKSNVNIERLHESFELLESKGNLPVDKYRTHILKGNYKGHFEAHIAADWLLIWMKIDFEIRLIRTGSHAELFK